MDYFTKYFEAFSANDEEGSIIAEALVQQWVSRFDIPFQIHSNQETNLTSSVFKGLRQLLPLPSEKYIRDPQARFRDVHCFAQERTRMATEKMKTRCDTKAIAHAFNKGDTICLWNSIRHNRPFSEIIIEMRRSVHNPY